VVVGDGDEQKELMEQKEPGRRRRRRRAVMRWKRPREARTGSRLT